MRKTPERIEGLAAEYVLGSLQGSARKRFERWMMDSYRVRQEVWFWEEKLSGLAEVVPAHEPPKRIWAAIEQHLWPEKIATKAASGFSWLWPSWGLMATAAAIFMAVMLVQQPEQERYPLLSGAIVQENIKGPLWLLSEAGENGETNRLRLRPVAAEAAQPDRDYELWVVPEEGQPLSLGVIPVGDDVLQIELNESVRAALEKSRTLAISLEPKGGSTTGAPTGPILHVTKLYEL